MFLYAKLEDLIHVQYVLAKHANISISESNGLPDFEREVYLSLLIDEIKKEGESLKS